MGKRVITEADVVEVAGTGDKIIEAPLGKCIVTDGARDRALSLGIEIQENETEGALSDSQTSPLKTSQSEAVVSQVTRLIKERLSTDLPPEKLELLVRQVAAAHLSTSQPPEKSNPDQVMTQSGGVCFIKGNMMPGDLTNPIPVEEKVMVADAFKCSKDSSLAGGYMEWSKGSFNRSMDHDEINIVLNGELHLTVEGRTTVVENGDMVYLPKGMEVVYSTPEGVKLACVNSLKK